MPTTRELLAEAGDRLRAAGVPSPEVDAELLLAHATGRARGLLRLSGTTVPEDEAAWFAALVDRRVQRIPLQHLTGRAPFRHIEVRVGPGVFIPRPETELLVDEVLAHLGISHGPSGPRAPGAPRGPSASTAPAAPGAPAATTPDGATASSPGEPEGPVIVDLCTGSAALAISLALEVPGSRVSAVELSDDALAWAADNVAEHEAAIGSAGSRVALVAADATAAAERDGPLSGLRGQVDVVVTNPPYVPDWAIPREPEVRDHDPAMALYGGADGLDVVRSLAHQAALLLRPGGLLLIEHADVQGEQAGSAGVPTLLRTQQDPAMWRDVVDHEDLAGRPRRTSAIRSDHPVGPAADAAAAPRARSDAAPRRPESADAPPGPPGSADPPAAAPPDPSEGRMGP